MSLNQQICLWGRGVEVIESTKVIELIQQLESIEVQKISARGGSFNFSIWNYIILKKRTPFLLLQTCCPSKEIIYEGEVYRPTARAVIEATFSDDLSELVLPTLRILGSYWKFPIKKFDDLTTLSLVSHVDEDSPTARIEPNDWENIQSELQTYLPPILKNLYSVSFDELSSHFQRSSALIKYQKILEIDEKSRAEQQKYSLPSSEEALSCFEQFTYGGPGFDEYLDHFKHQICIPSGIDETIAPTPLPVSNSKSNMTFFNSKVKNISPSKEESDLTLNDFFCEVENNTEVIEAPKFTFNLCHII